MGEVVQSNADMDFLSSTKSDPVFHFDSERVDEAAAVLRQLWAHTLLSLRARQYQSARRSLGQLCHSLQVLQERKTRFRISGRTSLTVSLSVCPSCPGLLQPQ